MDNIQVDFKMFNRSYLINLKNSRLAVSITVDFALKSFSQGEIDEKSITIDRHWLFDYNLIFSNQFKANQISLYFGVCGM